MLRGSLALIANQWFDGLAYVTGWINLRGYVQTWTTPGQLVRQNMACQGSSHS